MHYNRNATFLSSGRVGRVPHAFCVGLAMGDRTCNSPPPCISWTSYSNEALLKTLQEITGVLQQRLSDPATSSAEQSAQGVPAGATTGGGGQGLVKPRACGFTCRWCDSACTRKEGHSFHSCYEHRHRR